MSTTDKTVQFGSMEVREYPMMIGDHPHCSQGTPVQIDWVPERTYSCDVRLYEFMRSDRRHGRELIIPFQERARLLLDVGYSLEELGEATLSVYKIKKQREESMRSHPGWERASEIIEKTGKLPKNILSSFSALMIKPKQRSDRARAA